MAEEISLSSSSSSSSSSSNVVDSINSVFGVVPSRAEANYSMKAVQSFMTNEGPRMLVRNPEFQPVNMAFQFMRTPMVQEMVRSVMCDIGVISAIVRNEAVQGFLRSLMLDNSTMRLTNGADIVASPTLVQESHSSESSLVSMILRWLLDNMESGLMGIFGTLKLLVNNIFESTQNENTRSTDSGKFIYSTLLLVVINLLIVFVRRALKQKFKV